MTKNRYLAIDDDKFKEFEDEFHREYFQIRLVRYRIGQNQSADLATTRSDWIRSKFPKDLDITCKVVFKYDTGFSNRTIVLLNCDDTTAIQLLLTYDYLKEYNADSDAE